jgi:hypothetical protein
MDLQTSPQNFWHLRWDLSPGPKVSMTERQTSSSLLSLYCLPEGLSHHGITPTSPSQPWPHMIPDLVVLSAPYLRSKTKPRVDSGMSYATLEEACLVSAPGDLLPPVNTPFCWRQQEWKFLCG